VCQCAINKLHARSVAVAVVRGLMAADAPGNDQLPTASEARGSREADDRVVGAVPAGRRT